MNHHQRGFTLVELVVAITLTGVVALLVYGAANAALATQTRLQETRLRMQSERAWAALVEDALRNARPARVYGDPAFILESGSDAMGLPRDRLWFITAGATPPLTADSDWEVVLEASQAGVRMTALPVGVDAPPIQLTTRPEMAGLNIRVLAPDPVPRWLESWTNTRMAPRAIELTYWTEAGPAGPSVYLALPLGALE
jgi:prepilin-type N-terminal cleavage/methylation domain-containing protein